MLCLFHTWARTHTHTFLAHEHTKRHGPIYIQNLHEKEDQSLRDKELIMVIKPDHFSPIVLGH